MHLRPREGGYQLPYDPIGVTAGVRTRTRRATASRAAVTPRPHAKAGPRIWPCCSDHVVGDQGLEP
jgi:hypothetical protein